MQFAERGSIWTVPSVGKDALCVIVSSVRGVARNRPEYQVVPLYLPGLIGAQTSNDFWVSPSESDLGVEYYAALWNARPILHADLGKQVGRVAETVLRDLRDAQLQTVDPKIRMAPGRLGHAKPDAAVADWRRREIEAWQPLSGRVLTRIVATQAEDFGDR